MSCGKTTTRRQVQAKRGAARVGAARRKSTGTAKALAAKRQQQSYAAFVRQLKHYYHTRHLAHLAHLAAAAGQQASHPAKRRAAHAARKHNTRTRIQCQAKTRKAVTRNTRPPVKITAPVKSRALVAAQGRRAALPNRAAKAARATRARRR